MQAQGDLLRALAPLKPEPPRLLPQNHSQRRCLRARCESSGSNCVIFRRYCSNSDFGGILISEYQEQSLKIGKIRDEAKPYY